MITQQKVKAVPRERVLARPDLDAPAPAGHRRARGRAARREIATGRGADGKVLTRVPIPVTRELLERGRGRFEINCAVCHGYLGDGVSLVARNMSLRPPPSLLARAQQPDGWYFQVMSEGFGVMPSYASHLTVEDRWAVVAYLRALQLSQSQRADQLAAGGARPPGRGGEMNVARRFEGGRTADAAGRWRWPRRASALTLLGALLDAGARCGPTTWPSSTGPASRWAALIINMAFQAGKARWYVVIRRLLETIPLSGVPVPASSSSPSCSAPDSSSPG